MQCLAFPEFMQSQYAESLQIGPFGWKKGQKWAPIIGALLDGWLEKRVFDNSVSLILMPSFVYYVASKNVDSSADSVIKIFTQVVVHPAKCILHWHFCPIRSLAWTPEGSFLYSGGDERTLCKWSETDQRTPSSFVPRIGSEIIGISVWAEGVAVQLANNSVKLYNRQEEPVQELLGISR